jgi:hypothetical protein
MWNWKGNLHIFNWSFSHTKQKWLDNKFATKASRAVIVSSTFLLQNGHFRLNQQISNFSGSIENQIGNLTILDLHKTKK